MAEQRWFSSFTLGKFFGKDEPPPPPVSGRPPERPPEVPKQYRTERAGPPPAPEGQPQPPEYIALGVHQAAEDIRARARGEEPPAGGGIPPSDQDPSITRTAGLEPPSSHVTRSAPRRLPRALLREADALVDGFSEALRGAFGFFTGMVVVTFSFVVLAGVASLFAHAPLVASTILGTAVVLVVVSRRSRLRRLGVAGGARLHRLALGVHARGFRCVVVRVLAGVAVVLFAYFVWPTLYTYHPVGRRLVQVNRITGTASYVPIHPAELDEPSPRRSLGIPRLRLR